MERSLQNQGGQITEYQMNQEGQSGCHPTGKDGAIEGLEESKGLDVCVPSPSSKVSMLKSLSSKWGYQQVGASPSLITGVEPSSALLLPL